LKKLIYILLIIFLFNIQTPPTKDQVLEFLIKDKTDLANDSIGCEQFAKNLIVSGKKDGLYFYRETINFQNGTRHMINVIDTIDGKLYIEPQNDEIYIAPKVDEFLCTENFCMILDDYIITQIFYYY
jgi:hypothetical protein